MVQFFFQFLEWVLINQFLFNEYFVTFCYQWSASMGWSLFYFLRVNFQFLLNDWIFSKRRTHLGTREHHHPLVYLKFWNDRGDEDRIENIRLRRHLLSAADTSCERERLKVAPCSRARLPLTQGHVIFSFFSFPYSFSRL